MLHVFKTLSYTNVQRNVPVPRPRVYICTSYILVRLYHKA